MHIADSDRLHGLDVLRATSPMIDAVIEEIDGRRIRVGDRWLIDYASCNYLGFDLEPEIIDAIDGQVRRWGTHPSWSRLLGNPRLYPASRSGSPNCSAPPTRWCCRPSRSSTWPSSRSSPTAGRCWSRTGAHKTIYDGARYARGLGSAMVRFRAGDLDRLDDRLSACGPGPRLVCLDGVNSMTGNIPDLRAYAGICRAHDAILYVDDAHGFGVIGERAAHEPSSYGLRGNAIVAHLGLDYDNIVLVGGFSKAYSSLLAFLAVPTALKNRLKVEAPPYLYSGPSPTASLATVLAGFDVNERRGDAIRTRLHGLTARVLDHVRALGVATPNTTGTPIVELPLAHEHDLAKVAGTLWDSGVYLTLASYPLVPHTEVGLRVQVTAAHTDAEIEHLNAVLTLLARDGALRTVHGG